MMKKKKPPFTPLPVQFVRISRAEIPVGDYLSFLCLPLRVRDIFWAISEEYYAYLRKTK